MRIIFSALIFCIIFNNFFPEYWQLVIVLIFYFFLFVPSHAALFSSILFHFFHLSCFLSCVPERWFAPLFYFRGCLFFSFTLNSFRCASRFSHHLSLLIIPSSVSLLMMFSFNVVYLFLTFMVSLFFILRLTLFLSKQMRICTNNEAQIYNF